MSIKLHGSAVAEWRAHWTVVLAACIGMCCCTVSSYSIGLFIDPLQRAFGWTRVDIMAGPALSAVICFFCAPVSGGMIDRFGARRVGLAGTIGMAVSLCGFAFMTPSVWVWLLLWVPLSIAYSCLLPHIWAASVSGFFQAGRGLAMGVALCGSGISSLIMPLYAFFLIDRFEWRLAFVGLAAFVAVAYLPILLLFLSSAQDHARRGKAAPAVPVRVAGALRGHIMTRRFAQIALGAFLAACIVPSLVQSAVPVLVSGGLSRIQAASIASLIGLASITGRIGIGALLDRVDGRIVATCVVCLPMVTAALLIAMPGSVPAATVAVLFLGLALGAESDMVAYLTSRYFSLGQFGTLFGLITGLIALGGSGTPLLLSAVYDHTGSYVPALWAVLPACPLAALLFLTLGRYPEGATDPAVGRN